jgi:imidazolonepropionase
MPDLLIHRVSTLYTCNPASRGLGRQHDVSIGFTDGRISFLGDAELAEAQVGESTTVLDGRGLILAPGLVDCHTHSVWGGSRAGEFAKRLAGESYIDILEQGGGILSTVRQTRAASYEELERGCRLRLEGMLRHGVTTAEVKSGYGLTVEHELRCLRAARACNGGGVGAGASCPRVVTTFLGAHTVPPEYRDDRPAYVRQVIHEQLPRVQAEGLADCADVFCDRGAFTLAEARDILTAGQAAGLRVKAHAEQIQHTGCAQLVAELGGVSADHLEKLDADGVRALAQAGTVAVMLPGAQLYLHDASPPTPALREAGVRMAVATDLNPGSSPVHDLWAAATLSLITQGLTVDEAFLGITRNAALALGRPDLGWLGPEGSGSVADAVLLAPPPGEPPLIQSVLQHMGGHRTVAVVRNGVLVHDAAGAAHDAVREWKVEHFAPPLPPSSDDDRTAAADGARL